MRPCQKFGDKRLDNQSTPRFSSQGNLCARKYFPYSQILVNTAKSKFVILPFNLGIRWILFVTFPTLPRKIRRKRTGITDARQIRTSTLIIGSYLFSFRTSCLCPKTASVIKSWPIKSYNYPRNIREGLNKVWLRLLESAHENEIQLSLIPRSQLSSTFCQW